jgi:hypothetical protein
MRLGAVLMIGAAACALTTTGATAQVMDDDVVVMRRVVAKPDPNFEPTKPYMKVPTRVSAPKPTTWPLVDGTVTVSSRDGVICVDGKNQPVAMTNCEKTRDPRTVGEFQIPAVGNAYLRTIAIDPAVVKAKVPTAGNVDALCGTAISVNNQAWRLSCVASDVATSYARRATAVTVEANPFPLAGGLSLRTDVSGVLCVDTQTGASAPTASCTGVAPTPGVGRIMVPAQVNADLRVAVINADDVLSQSPDLSAASVQSLCSTTVPIGGATWKLRCDADLLRNHYQRVATRAQVASPALPYASAGKPNYAGDVEIATNAGGVICRDTDTGRPATDATWCDALANPPEIGVFRQSATMSPSFRTIVLDRAAVLAKAPNVANMDEVCQSGFWRYGANSLQEYWFVRCDPAAISARYVKVATSASPVTVQTTDSAKFLALGRADFAGSLSFTTAGSGVVCRDTTTGQPATDTTRCNALANPPSVGTMTVNATFSPSFRTVVFNWDDLLAQSPELTNKAQVCANAGSTVPIALNGTSFATYKISCDPASIRAHYEKVATTAIPNTPPRTQTYATVSGGGSTTFTSPYEVNTLTNVKCRDTDTRTFVTGGQCDYLANPSSVGQIPVTATFLPATRRMYINWNDIKARAPEITDNSICSSTVSVYGTDSSTGANYRITCNADDVRMHYEKIPTYAQASATVATQKYSVVVGGAGDPFDGRLSVHTLSSVSCRDTDTRATATGMCDYMPNPASIGVFNLDATFSPQTRRVYVDWTKVSAIAPTIANQTGFCSGGMTMSVYGSDYPSNSATTYTVTCNANDVRPHYAKIPTYAQPTTTIVANRTYPEIQAGAAAPFDGKLSVHTLSNVKCRDTDTNAYVTGGQCDYMVNPSNVAVLPIDATFAPQLRRVYVDWTKIAAIAPDVTNQATFCSGMTVSINGYDNTASYASTTYTTTCNPNDVRAHYEKVATTAYPAQTNSGKSAADIGVGAADFTGRLNANTLSGVKCRDTDTRTYVTGGQCDYMANPPSVANFQVPVTFSPSYRTVLVNWDDVTAIAPELNNKAQFCSQTSNMTVSITDQNGYNGIAYRVSCDPASIRPHYEKVATAAIANTVNSNKAPSLIAPGGDAFAGRLDVSTLGGVKCRDTDNGTFVTGGQCDYVANPPSVGTVSYDATFAPSFQTVVVDWNQIQARSPEVTNKAAFCAGTVNVYSANYGSYYTYKVRCDQETIRPHYEKVATTATANTKVTNLSQTAVAGPAPDFQNTLELNTLSGVKCRDTDNGTFVTGGQCDALANPSSVGTLSIPATYSPNFRTVVVNWNDVASRATEVVNRDAFCNSNMTVYTSGYSYNYAYKVRCDAEAIRPHYEKVATVAEFSTQITAQSNATIVSGGDNFTSNLGYTTAGSGVKCRDTDTGAFVTGGQCDYIANPASVGTFGYATTYSPKYRRVYVDWDAIVAKSPEVANRAQLCSKTFPVYSSGYSTSATYTATCNADDVRIHHEVVSTTAIPTSTYANKPYSAVNPATAPAFTAPISFQTTSGRACRDTDNGQTVDASLCAYFPNPASIGNPLQVAATWTPSTKKVSVRWSDVLTMNPNATNKAAFCSATIVLYASDFGNATYQVSCPD